MTKSQEFTYSPPPPHSPLHALNLAIYNSSSLNTVIVGETDL